jgi:hypothetical protein
MIFEELASLTGARLLYLPALCSTLWSLHGVFVRHWRIGEIFLWSWCELFLSALSGILLIYRRERLLPTGTVEQAMKAALGVAMALLMVGFFATLFSILAWTGDFESLKTLPAYLREHQISFVVLACGFTAAHLTIVHRRGFALASQNDLLKPLTNKMWPVLGLYFVMIEQYHLTGSTELKIDGTYLLMMGGSFLGFKLATELWHLWKGVSSKSALRAMSEAHHPPKSEVL